MLSTILPFSMDDGICCRAFFAEDLLPILFSVFQCLTVRVASLAGQTRYQLHYPLLLHLETSYAHRPDYTETYFPLSFKVDAHCEYS